MSAISKTIFRDLITRDTGARHDLEVEQATLTARTTPNDDEKADLERINALLELDPEPVVDPLFVAVRDAFNDDSSTSLLSNVLEDHKSGVLKFGGDAKDMSPDEQRRRADDVVRVAFVLGLLAFNESPLPRLKADDGSAVTDTTDPHYGDFMEAFYAALGRARGSFALAKLVLPILQIEGDPDGVRGSNPGEVETEEFAAVMDCLRSKQVTEREPQLRRRVNECLDKIQATKIDPPVTEMTISLPDLDAVTAYQIQVTNVEAIGPIICAAMFDELKAFAVVDKLIELSQTGMLPTGISEAGAMLYEYWKSAPNRMSDAERHNFYALTIGIPGGTVNGAVNRDFNDLWIRFVSSVSKLVRQRTTDDLLRAKIPASITQQQVRKAARDLAMNLSSHGYGMVNYAARDLQLQITTMINLLSHPEIMAAYGAKDMWQVIDQVAALELGGARNSARFRTLATCGAIITKWLSQNVRKYNSVTSTVSVIDVDSVISANPPSSNGNATRKPTDYDLVNACELWLADTAVAEDRVEELAQPRESPAMTSRPVQIPSIAKDILDQTLPPGLGLSLQRR
jgi:hypothetical protein